uniref:Uncharacterized protein n=1 Tax=Physcomitrium patens TaxID=3218 RepID=A0A7I4DVX5_PHYPA
ILYVEYCGVVAHLTEELPTFAFKCNTKNKRTYLEMISFVTATENAEVLQGSDTLGAETVFNHSRITPEIKRKTYIVSPKKTDVAMFSAESVQYYLDQVVATQHLPDEKSIQAQSDVLPSGIFAGEEFQMAIAFFSMRSHHLFSTVK